MHSVLDILEKKISEVMAEVTGQAGCTALVKPATDPKFGDYQVNGVMPLAKQLKTNPRKLAEQIVAELIQKSSIEEQVASIETAGPGFINLRLKPGFVAKSVLEVTKDPDHLGIEKADKPKTIVVDFSGPNIAKHMHVGHLRSSIIGDCICRLLELQSHKVIRQNHIGNWGRNFGMVILGLWHICMAEKRVHEKKDICLYYSKEIEELKACAEEEQARRNLCQRILVQHERDWEADYKFRQVSPDGELTFHPFLRNLKNRDPNKLLDQVEIAYRFVNMLEECANGLGLKIKTRHLTDPNQIELIPYEYLSRRITAMLHQGNEIGQEINDQEDEGWIIVGSLTTKECNEIFEKLNVGLKDEHVRGESFYKDMLTDVVEELKKLPQTRKSEGALCVFPEGFKDKEGKPLPVIVQKSDGAFLYATTDLAAIRYRMTGIKYEGKTYKANEIIYVTDARQSLHFQMVFKVAEMAGWSKQEMLHHVTFGSVLGEDSKPLKTRSGENVKLKELLDEAVTRARKIVDEKNPELSEAERVKIAQAVGIGAVKYADYTNNRTSDYIFSFNKMLAMEGNTAPYMQYAYARVKSINRKGKERGIDVDKELSQALKNGISLTEPSELDLAKHLIRYGEAVEAAVADYRPNYLTSYLYDLSQKFSGFYANCPVLEDTPQRPTRLLLCDLTAQVIEHGLRDLLGIEVIEQM